MADEELAPDTVSEPEKEEQAVEACCEEKSTAETAADTDVCVEVKTDEAESVEATNSEDKEENDEEKSGEEAIEEIVSEDAEAAKKPDSETEAA